MAPRRCFKSPEGIKIIAGGRANASERRPRNMTATIPDPEGVAHARRGATLTGSDSFIVADRGLRFGRSRVFAYPRLLSSSPPGISKQALSAFFILRPFAQSFGANLFLFARAVAVRGVVRLGHFNRTERDGRAARQPPVIFRLDGRRARAAVSVVFARPENRPDLARGRREQRLGRG